jgi:hypothetical protein
MRGGGGCATNFVQSFLLSLSNKKMVRTKNLINSNYKEYSFQLQLKELFEFNFSFKIHLIIYV